MNPSAERVDTVQGLLEHVPDRAFTELAAQGADTFNVHAALVSMAATLGGGAADGLTIRAIY